MKKNNKFKYKVSSIDIFGNRFCLIINNKFYVFKLSDVSEDLYRAKDEVRLNFEVTEDQIIWKELKLEIDISFLLSLNSIF